MTRKRFVKRLMGDGVSRNEAVRLTKMRAQGCSHEEFYDFARFIAAMQGVGISARRTRRAFRSASRAMYDAGSSMGHLGRVATYVFLDESSPFPEFPGKRVPPC